jgi:MinD superfamily P-loop ATPase
MKQVVVISGKGGTGKTTVSASLAMLSEAKQVVADCDVDAANLHLVLDARQQEKELFVSGVLGRIDPEKCTRCGLCVEACRFEAIKENSGIPQVIEHACEGCGVCAWVCPSGAATLEEADCGEIMLSETPAGPLVHAALFAGRENSGRLVTAVREKASNLGQSIDAQWVLIDGSPGVACPVIASLTGADLALIVAEPTPAGLQGMERALQTALHFGIESRVCLNKADLNEEMAEGIVQSAKKSGARVIGKIPFDPKAVDAARQGKPLIEMKDSPAAREIRRMSEGLFKELDFQETGGRLEKTMKGGM